MSRLRHRDVDYASPELLFFVTIRARPNFAPFSDACIAGDVVTSLLRLREARGVRIYAYCLMPDHLHLLMRLGDGGVPLWTVIGSFKSYTTRSGWGRGNRGVLWQERFHDHVVRKNEDARTIATYILQNPVRKGLAVDAYAFEWGGSPDPM